MPSAPNHSSFDESRAISELVGGKAVGTDTGQSTEVRPTWHEVTAGEKTLAGLARMARAIYEMRARRARYFRETALSKAAWDILLCLFADTIEGLPASTKSVGISGGVPVSSCLAILDRLEADGMVVRKQDEFDRRVTRVVMSPTGLLKMRDYLRNEAVSSSGGSSGDGLLPV